jgi:hypothetical protein
MQNKETTGAGEEGRESSKKDSQTGQLLLYLPGAQM